LSRGRYNGNNDNKKEHTRDEKPRSSFPMIYRYH
jgi:hypothetical protein